MNKINEKEGIYGINKWGFFLIVCFITLLLLLMKKNFVENETTAFEILAERGEMGVFQAINTLQYLSIPVVYIIKFTIIAFVIWIGCFMFGYRISFGDTWHVVLVSEIIFFIPELLKIMWFMFVETNANYFDIREFYPLSLINLVDTEYLESRWFYPLKALNVFEVIYWFILVSGIHSFARKKLSITYYIIFSSYVLFFL
ncbi:MAG: hypothetical protein AAFN93_04345, partial [Bacteroidota bacterium]